MKLNNNGWSFREMIIIMSILIFCLLLVVFYIYRLYSQIDKNYDSSEIIETNDDIKEYYEVFENELENGAINYIDNYYEGEMSSSFIITLDDIKDAGLIDSIKGYKDNYECNGYVKVAKYNEEYEYTPFLKCQNYKTKNYNSVYE